MVITFEIKRFAKHMLKIAHIHGRASHHLKKSDRWVERAAVLAVVVFALTTTTGFLIQHERLTLQPTTIALSSSSTTSR